MEFSLNELEMLALKAARGAGLEWGLAEDAGNAAKWLAVHDLDGAGAVCEVLLNFEKVEFSDLMPRINGENWSATEQVSALLAGIKIAGRPGLLETSEIHIRNLDCPLFLLPFLIHASFLLKKPLGVVAGKFEACLSPEGLDHTGGGDEPTDAKIFIAQNAPSQPLKNVLRANITARDMKRLNDMAQRIYAPSTESSRQNGAGADDENDDE